jgi:uncharacterized coiled-coil protein SlyX
VFGSHIATYIAGIYGTPTLSGIPVYIDATGQLGTVSSSRRFKEEIEPMKHVSEAILALKPVTFHYTNDTTNRPQFGLIAEDVAEVNPHLVVRDRNGEIYTVRYEAVNAMLLNEFLKEHKAFTQQQQTVEEQGRKLREQEAAIGRLNKQVEALVAHAKEQDSKIQKVSAQVESARVPQLVSIP